MRCERTKKSCKIKGIIVFYGQKNARGPVIFLVAIYFIFEIIPRLLRLGGINVYHFPLPVHFLELEILHGGGFF